MDVRTLGMWVALLVLLPAAPLAGAPAWDPPAARSATHAPPALPAGFLENLGQLGDPSVAFYGRAGGLSVAFGEGFVSYADARGAPGTVRLTFPAARAVAPHGEGEHGHRTNFLRGDASLHAEGVRTVREVAYRGLYEGVDLVYRHADRGLKYDFLLDRGATPEGIAIALEGAGRLEVTDGGELLVEAPWGTLRDAAPVAFQGSRVVPCAYALDGAQVRFSCPGWDPAEPGTLDPLVYATYLGGSEEDLAHAVATDPFGNVYVAGATRSPDLPATPGTFGPTHAGVSDAFVARYRSNGSVAFVTYLGGWAEDFAYAVAADVNSVYVAGLTRSVDFPASPFAFDRTYNGEGDAFVVKLNALGERIWSTFLGGRGFDLARALFVDGTGRVYVGGQTGSADFPITAGVLDGSLGGPADGFVAALSPNGDLLQWSTYLGGSQHDSVSGLAVGPSRVFVSGETASTDFPVTAGALDTTFGGASDAFTAWLDPGGTFVAYATFLGGPRFDRAVGVGFDVTGDVYVAGYTEGDIPTTAGSFSRTYRGGGDGFLVKLTALGVLEYGTYLGGAGPDRVEALVVRGERTFLAGVTGSPDFPATPGAASTALRGAEDGFLASLDEQGDEMAYATFLGGLGEDRALGLAVAPSGIAYVAGWTGSVDFPATANAADPDPNGGRDAFLAGVDVTSLRITLDTAPAGLDVVLDGRRMTAPVSFWCVQGAARPVDVPSPQEGPTVRHTFASWSDGEAQAHAISCTAAVTLTASFLRDFAITVRTTPPGLNVSVDGVVSPAPVSGWWREGTSFTVSALSPQTQPGVRNAFLSWSDGGAQTHDVTATAPATITATFARDYEIVVRTQPTGRQVDVAGVRLTAPVLHWCPASTSVNVRAESPETANLTRYLFEAWSDGGTQLHAVACTGPKTVTATFVREFFVTIDTSPTNLPFTLDGQPRVGSVSSWWREGSAHVLEAGEFLAVDADVRYRWVSWSDGGPARHDVAAASPGPIVASFLRQFRLSVSSPVGTATCDRPDCWYDQGARATFAVSGLEASDRSLRLFRGWTGSATASSATATVVMDEPKSVVATWELRHRLDVHSRFGSVTGSGWYAPNETASFRLDATEVRADDATYVFAGWTGDAAGTGAEGQVSMDGAKSVVARWERVVAATDLAPWLAAVAVAAILLLAWWRGLLAKVLRR